MRFAKQEVSIITAFFLAAFDAGRSFEEVKGAMLAELEDGDIKDIANNVPKILFFVKRKRREGYLASAIL
jgi:cytochrome c553